MTSFRQIKTEEWIKGDYREFAEINVKTSYLAEKYEILFETYFEPGMGNTNVAGFITDNGTRFFLVEYLDAREVVTEIGCLNNPETIAKDLDEILEVLELSTSNIIYLFDNIKLIPHELWRQDDNGHKFLIKTFPCKADAVKAMKEFERRLHKQTYWIEKAK